MNACIYTYVQSGTMQCMCFTNSPLCIVFHNNNNTERLSVGGDGLVVMGWWVESKSSVRLQLTPFNFSFSFT